MKSFPLENATRLLYPVVIMVLALVLVSIVSRDAVEAQERAQVIHRVGETIAYDLRDAVTHENAQTRLYSIDMPLPIVVAVARSERAGTPDGRFAAVFEHTYNVDFAWIIEQEDGLIQALALPASPIERASMMGDSYVVIFPEYYSGSHGLFEIYVVYPLADFLGESVRPVEGYYWLVRWLGTPYESSTVIGPFLSAP